jgi:hypothetical protein
LTLLELKDTKSKSRYSQRWFDRLDIASMGFLARAIRKQFEERKPPELKADIRMISGCEDRQTSADGMCDANRACCFMGFARWI